MYFLIPLFFYMSLFTANGRNKDFISIRKYFAEQTLLNVPYGNHHSQVMDIYLPAGRSANVTPSLILIHGGGWNSGNKSNFATYIDSFKKRMPEMAIFNINYRLATDKNLFPAQEEDIKQAIDFIFLHASEYLIDKDQFVLLGASAGSHLALLQAYKYNQPCIQAVIDYFGPTDLVSMYRHPWHPLVPYALQMVTGTTPDVNQKLYENSSPVNFISHLSVPTLIFHGGKDPIVDISQSKILKDKLDKYGIINEMVVYPEEHHGWYGKNLSNSFDHIESFLRLVLKKSKLQ